MSSLYLHHELIHQTARTRSINLGSFLCILGYISASNGEDALIIIHDDIEIVEWVKAISKALYFWPPSYFNSRYPQFFRLRRGRYR